MRLSALLAVAALLLVGCVSKPESFGSPAVISPVVAATETVFVATSRKPVADARILFGGERSRDVNFVKINVSLPQKRVLGSIEYTGGKPDPSKQFTLISADKIDNEAAFTGRLRSALASQPVGKRSVLIFIHGYNVPFSAGVFGAAQLRHDYELPGIIVHYSWPSANKTALYLYDRDSAEFARNGLTKTIKAVLAAKPAKTFVLGHSMGTFVTMEALRTLSISGEQSTVGKIDALILAAPDIDIDVFRSQLADIPVRPKTMLVLVSAKDRALKISSGLRGGKERVGSGANKEELVAQGMIVLDVATLREKGDQLSHSTFSNSEELIRLVTGGLNLNALERAEKGNPVNLIGEGFGAAGDLISSIVYLPAQIAGAR